MAYNFDDDNTDFYANMQQKSYCVAEISGSYRSFQIKSVTYIHTYKAWWFTV